MIVLAVLGLAIGIAYATANRSLLDARQAQENAEASQLVQSQIEALRTMTLDPAPNNIFQPGPYCVTQTPPYAVLPSGSGGCNIGAIPYTLTITYTNVPSDTFTVKATWPDVSGDGSNDTVTMNYRLHTPNTAAFVAPPVIPPTPPTATISASPTSVAMGSSSTLTWSSTNTSSCTASGAWSGSQPTSGSASTGSLSSTSSFTITCAGTNGGNAAASTTVNVTCPVGQTGTPPVCGTCPWYDTGIYPNCQPASL